MSDHALAMNPFVDIHIHPAPEAYPIDLARIETITVKCPVRGRGLVIHELTATGDPALFAFFRQLVARDGELELDSDAPLVEALATIGFLVEDDDVVAWPQLEIPLDDADGPTPDATWIVAPSFRFQPAFALHPDVRWPVDYDEQDGRLRCFAPGPAFWLGEPTELVAPRWVRPDVAARLAGFVPGALPPPLPAPLARALAQAGALTPAGAAPAPLAAFARHRPAYAADGYVIARDLLPASELAALRRYYAALLAADLVQLGDRQHADRFSAYNDPVGRFVQARLRDAMSAVVGQPVEPSFSFFFAYREGAALAPHKDRAQAEFSISLQLDHTPAPDAATGWPLCFTFDDGRTAAADLRIGDAVLYHGRALTHHRAALPAGQRSSVLVLEYVPRDFPGLRI
jgi:hypothetical protein